MRRVVVTGLGMVTPLGSGVDTTWARILKGESGARCIEHFDVSDLSCQIACVIPRGDGTNGTFNPDLWMEPKEQRKVDDFIVYAMAAAGEALNDANWHPSTEEDRCATGTMIGSGIGGIEGIGDAAVTLKERGPRKLSRLTKRGTERDEEVARRLRGARKELARVQEFDHVVVNDDLERAVEEVRAVARTGQTRVDGDIQSRIETLLVEIDRVLQRRYENVGA